MLNVNNLTTITGPARSFKTRALVGLAKELCQIKDVAFIVGDDDIAVLKALCDAPNPVMLFKRMVRQHPFDYIANIARHVHVVLVDHQVPDWHPENPGAVPLSQGFGFSEMEKLAQMFPKVHFVFALQLNRTPDPLKG